ncbi:MAG TPA: hypothetical protein VME46_03105 [Acidimicrobiales bacterium]|nr:hypothetical protein [Acidimicrobiales bacterium]
MTKTTVLRGAVVVVLAALGFFMASCGGSPAHNGVAGLGQAETATTRSSAPAGSGSPGQSGPTEVQLLEYAKCIRSHGVSDFPDPAPVAGGGYAFRVQPDANPRSPTPQFQAAENACEKDVPPSLAKLTPAQMMANALKYAVCMRAHGEPDFPDPNGQGMIKINPTGAMSPSSPEFQRAEKACQNLDNGSFDEEITSGGP